MSAPPTFRQARGVRRWVYLVLGWLFVTLGGLGAFLPVLPTTPFLILAAALFARSSPRFHAALLGNRILGPYLRQWHTDRSVPADAKRRAYAVILMTFAVSIYLVRELWVRIALLGVALGVILFLSRLKTTSRLVGDDEPARAASGSVRGQDLDR